MGLTILSWSNFLAQPTGYGTTQRHLLPYINDETDHDVIQLAQSGLQDSTPITVDGVKVYPSSPESGLLSCQDVPPIVAREDVDIVFVQLDLWAHSDRAADVISSLDVPVVVYPPLHTDPLPSEWAQVIAACDTVVPFTEFGERVLTDADVSDGTLREPIWHGVDTDAFRPLQPDEYSLASPADATDEFTVGIFKNLKGKRNGYDVMLRAFAEFVEREQADDARLYLHCSTIPEESWDVVRMAEQLGIRDRVKMPPRHEYNWGLDDPELNELYNVSDVVLNVTRAEGFGLPILEAFAAGTPVIGGAFSAMPELIHGDEGEISTADTDDAVIDAPRGWLVPADTDDYLISKHRARRNYRREHVVDALSHAYNNQDEVAQKGDAARAFAEDHPWTAKAEAFIDVFEAVGADELRDAGVEEDVKDQLAALGYT